MLKADKVEVFRDRPYYIVKNEDGKIVFEMLSTHALYSIIDTLKRINNMDENDVLIACCYQEYQGSFNIQVDKDSQYKAIYDYAKKHYATFEQKMMSC